MQDDVKVVVDDSYLIEMAEYFEKQGKQLQSLADAYIAAMGNIAKEGVMEGRTADAIQQFISFAQKQLHAIAFTSERIRDCVVHYQEEIDIQDQYHY